MRVIQFDAENSYIGNYKYRMPVIDAGYHGEPATVIAEFLSESVDDLISDLNYYGFGDKFISLFTDIKYENTAIGTPSNYDAQSLLHQIYPSMDMTICHENTTLSNAITIFDRTLIYPITVTIATNETKYNAYGDIESYILTRSCDVHWISADNYGFSIDIYGVYTDQMNGNKFDFTGENTDAAHLYIGINKTSQNTWYTQIIIYGGSYPIGLNLRNLFDGQEADDAEQDSDDPYDDGGNSDGGGGGGSFDDSSDDVDFPDLPTMSATDTGFITLFVPSLSQLQALATYMWTDPTFDLEFWRKIVANPMDAILGFSIIPYAVPTSGAVNVTVGNIPTNVSMNKATAQFFAVDCGYITLEEYFGSYLDYEPYTQIEIYLPFVGIRKLNTDDLMPKTVHVKYHIDILTGACVAMVKCSKDGHGGVMYTYQGNCATEIPVTGLEFGNTIRSAVNFGVSTASLIASGGASAPVAIGGMANSVMTAKPTISKSNNIGASGGLMANKTPYLIIHRPNQCKPANQNKYLGYPAFITESISGLSGYTSFESVRLNNIKCNDIEMSEILSLLKEGVIL